MERGNIGQQIKRVADIPQIPFFCILAFLRIILGEELGAIFLSVVTFEIETHPGLCRSTSDEISRAIELQRPGFDFR